ncbi:DnaD domain protein [Virgibacillus sp. 179-BFC.A HS]|uniref:DnaD domain protein n=1 Tax=Tigheibacillus jepli TaxID=3035914 RepID=A0ABU5CGM0_9BACI|nr:DnaD domain protein [Virgibacillus sp. 179-BFC.A HS]MDY0405365.1 DnaD domain protein [Virgibacillus sp. 179-BFC.A HS]
MTKEEKLIHELEVMSPQQLLADLSKGNQASAQDMKVIRDVMTSQGLPAPVMNVLIHYVLLQSDMKLSKAYMETIASHWSRANLKTAKEAMAFAKKQQRTNYKPVKSRAKYRQYRQSARVVPDWIKDDHEEQKNNKESISNVNAQKGKRRAASFYQSIRRK